MGSCFVYNIQVCDIILYLWCLQHLYGIDAQEFETLHLSLYICTPNILANVIIFYQMYLKHAVKGKAVVNVRSKLLFNVLQGNWEQR